jgi:uncharacterized protein YhaN
MKIPQDTINEINERVAKIRRDCEAKVAEAQSQNIALADLVRKYQEENDRLSRTLNHISNNLGMCQELLRRTPCK